MKKIAAFIILAVAVAAPTGAFAYVGPGAGLSLLGALWAFLAAIGTALFFVIAWPVRKFMRRRRAAHEHNTLSNVNAAGAPGQHNKSR